MPNDAKLGMVVGVGLVIIVAVIFFRKDTTANDALATIPKSAPAVTQPPRDGAAVARTGGGQKYTVEDGDTLMSLSRRFYGTGDKFNVIYNANRDQLRAPDRLRAGMVLTIPDAQ
jgi:2',3'-cyclic-nucleotide 2'-phosphodiesterase/3'-nucleotidase